MAEPNSRCFQACTNCRKRKTKCVGSNPCGRCIKHGLTCSYSVPKKYSRNRKSQQKPLNQDIETFQQQVINLDRQLNIALQRVFDFRAQVAALQQQIEASDYVSSVQTGLNLQYRIQLSEYLDLQPTSPLSECSGDWFVKQWNQNCQSTRDGSDKKGGDAK